MMQFKPELGFMSNILASQQTFKSDGVFCSNEFSVWNDLRKSPALLLYISRKKKPKIMNYFFFQMKNCTQTLTRDKNQKDT